MTAFPPPSASKMGNLIVNPGGSTPGAMEVYLREWRWWALQMSPFWGFPALGGENVTIPQRDGQVAYRRFIDQGVYTTPIRVTGEAGVSGVAPSGTKPAAFFTELRSSLDFLWANVGTPPSAATRSARLILPDATAIDFDGQFALSLVQQSITDASLILDVTVPDGRIE